MKRSWKEKKKLGQRILLKERQMIAVLSWWKDEEDNEDYEDANWRLWWSWLIIKMKRFYQYLPYVDDVIWKLWG